MMKAYPEYIESREKWIGDIPKDWIETRFKFLFSQKGKISNIDLPCGSISFGNVVYKDSEKLTEETRLAYQEVLIGDFLVNPLNLNYDLKSLRTALSDKDVIVSSGYIVLKSNEDTVSEYLKWLLFVFDIRHMKNLGAGIRQTITAKDIGDCYTYLPSLSEQKSIAQFLDFETTRIDNLIAEKQRFIKLLSEKRQALISHVVTKGLDPGVELKDSGVEWLGMVPSHWGLIKVSRDIPYVVGLTPSTKEERYFYGENTWVSIEDMKKKEISNSKKKVSDMAVSDRCMNIVPKGSLLFSFKLSVGKVGFATLPLYTNEAIASFLENKVVDLSFLYYSAPVFIPKYGQENIYGALLMNQERINSAKTFMPSYSEQQQIANFLDKETLKIDTLISETKASISLLKEKRTALISAAVTGKIDVRGEV